MRARTSRNLPVYASGAQDRDVATSDGGSGRNIGASTLMTRIALTVLVAVHLAATVWHGGAHTELGILLPPEKSAFVYIVILAGPIVAASLLWTRHLVAGVWTFLLT